MAPVWMAQLLMYRLKRSLEFNSGDFEKMNVKQQNYIQQQFSLFIPFTVDVAIVVVIVVAVFVVVVVVVVDVVVEVVDVVVEVVVDVVVILVVVIGVVNSGSSCSE